ncbi:hypothetical protein FEDK69T_22530 [Flavobacterium enshiense DK69]|nr:hypothetical protein FEDK69T_22530 [Flavobacterium enshiense DK69]
MDSDGRQQNSDGREQEAGAEFDCKQQSVEAGIKNKYL